MTRTILVSIAGAFMIFSAFPHGMLGWPAMKAELARLAAGPDMVGGLGAGWLFGSATMATFGVIVLAGALRMRRGDRSGVFAIRAIAVCYVVFGLAAFVARGFEPFFLNFAATGVLAGVPTAGGGPRG